MSAAAAADVDPALAAEQIGKVEHLLESGLGRRGQALARGVLTRAVLAGGDVDRAIELCSQTIEATSGDPSSRLRPGAYAMRAEALALQASPDAGAAFLDAIEPATELGWWGQLWRYLIPLARWWIATGNATAAAHVLGHLTANDITLAGLDEQADALSDPSLQNARRGAQMSSTELLDHVLAELDPVSAGGRLAELRPARA